MARLAKRRIERYARKWRHRLLLSGWTINIVFEDEPCVDDALTLAVVSSTPTYYEIHINIYPPFWSKPVHEQERIILHELVHWYSINLKQLALQKRRAKLEIVQYETERLTEGITNIIWDCYEQ